MGGTGCGFAFYIATFFKVMVKSTDDLPLKLAKKAGPFLILPFLPFLIEDINLSDFIPINIGFLRGQGNNEDRFSAPLQY